MGVIGAAIGLVRDNLLFHEAGDAGTVVLNLEGNREVHGGVPYSEVTRWPPSTTSSEPVMNRP